MSVPVTGGMVYTDDGPRPPAAAREQWEAMDDLACSKEGTNGRDLSYEVSARIATTAFLVESLERVCATMDRLIESLDRDGGD